MQQQENQRGFTDDEYMSKWNIQSLHGLYASAPRDMRRIASADAGGQRIGHFGVFRRRFDALLWPQAGQWLERQAGFQH